MRLTHLRKQVLDIFVNAKKPLSAYQALNELKKLRDNPQPTTIYRVIDYLSEQGLLHRIENMNQFIACSHPSQHTGVIFTCIICKNATEYQDESVAAFVLKFSKKHGVFCETQFFELKGICNHCHKLVA